MPKRSRKLPLVECPLCMVKLRPENLEKHRLRQHWREDDAKEALAAARKKEQAQELSRSRAQARQAGRKWFNQKCVFRRFRPPIPGQSDQ